MKKKGTPEEGFENTNLLCHHCLSQMVLAVAIFGVALGAREGWVTAGQGVWLSAWAVVVDLYIL